MTFTMKVLRTEDIPDDVFADVLNELQLRFERLVENFDTYQEQELKRALVNRGIGVEHIPCCDLRKRGTAVRKNKKNGVKRIRDGHGPRSIEMVGPDCEGFSDRYLEYIQSDEWKERCKHEWIPAWDYRCAMCYGKKKLTCHHRTYARLGNEDFYDVLPLCNGCHKAADARRQWEQKNGSVRELFDD